MFWSALTAGCSKYRITHKRASKKPENTPAKDTESIKTNISSGRYTFWQQFFCEAVLKFIQTNEAWSKFESKNIWDSHLLRNLGTIVQNSLIKPNPVKTKRDYGGTNTAKD